MFGKSKKQIERREIFNSQCESTVKIGQIALLFKKTNQLVCWERRQPACSLAEQA